jgi:hypothetical protein
MHELAGDDNLIPFPGLKCARPGRSFAAGEDCCCEEGAEEPDRLGKK